MASSKTKHEESLRQHRQMVALRQAATSFLGGGESRGQLPVELSVSENGLLIRNPPAILWRLLQAPGYRLAAGEKGHMLFATGRPLYWTFRPHGVPLLDRMELPFPMVAVVEALLRTLSIPYSKHGNWSATHRRSVLAAARSEAVASQILREFFAGSSCSIIRGCERACSEIIVVDICRSFPHHNIAVCTATKASARKLRQVLADHGLRFRLRHVGDECAPAGEILIGTSAKLHAGISERSLVLFHGIASIRGRFAREAYQWSGNAAKVLVVEHHAQQSPQEFSVSRAWFGGRELKVPAAGQQVRPVQIAPVRVATRPESTSYGGSLAGVLAEFWHNGPRNRLLAQLAECIAGLRSVRSRFSEFVSSFCTNSTKMRVVVLVQSPEHAAALADRLSEWPIVTGEFVELGQLRRQWSTVLRERMTDDTTARLLIATFAAAGRIDWSSTDVVLRADGGAGLPPITDAALATSRLHPAPLVLVDVHDCAYPAGRERFQMRQEAYADRDWFQLGADPVFERMSRFVWSLFDRETRS